MTILTKVSAKITPPYLLLDKKSTSKKEVMFTMFVALFSEGTKAVGIWSPHARLIFIGWHHG